MLSLEVRRARDQFLGNLWWVCDCLSKCVIGTDNSFTSPGMFPRVSSFAFNSWNVLFLSDRFWKQAVIPTRSPRSEFAVTMAASRLEDAFIDLTANSIPGVIIISIAVKNAFWSLPSTVSTTWLISQPILLLKKLSNIWIFAVISMFVEILPPLMRVKSRSACIDYNILLPADHSVAKKTSWSKSFIC